MTLIKSISGIRGTIGGKPGEGLSPIDLVKFSSAYAKWLKERFTDKESFKVIIGRDARISGEIVSSLVENSLLSMGIDIINIGLATTPSVEMAVTDLEADGGIILTASHNTKQWNALKLLNEKGEFLSAADGEMVLAMAEKGDFIYAEVDNLGQRLDEFDYTDRHIEKILALPLVDAEAIKKAKFKVAVDAVNSVGGIAIPRLLKALGVDTVFELYCEPTGYFPHNPEPLPEHLTEISNLVVEKNADLAFVVDPDVDRLAVVNEDGSMFGEEYTLVAVSDYVLENNLGNTVSNMSSSRALRDITIEKGGEYYSAAVGEVNVVEKMKEVNAIIGGEGNGGVIYPALHYGRDALVGVALFLTKLAKEGISCSQLRAKYPAYFISKNKIQISSELSPDLILNHMKQVHSNEEISTIDGVKIDFEEAWVHLIKSNTEPIIRIYAEAKTKDQAEQLTNDIMTEIEAYNTNKS